MKERYKELREDVFDEKQAIEETLQRLNDVRSRYSPDSKDILIEPAMGTFLMNFYNGVENIIKRVAKVYYRQLPKGYSWHRELLQLSWNPPSGNIPLFSKEVVERLQIYRSFRHRFVSGYGFQLKAEKMLELIYEIESVWIEIKECLTRFFDELNKTSDR